MKTKKGISPLIASVILIAFVIAIAGIVSGFFTGFVQSQTGQVGERATKTIDCSVANFKILPETVDYDSSSGGLEVSLTVTGKTALANWVFTAMNTSYSDSNSPEPTELSPGETHHFLVQVGPVQNAYRIVARSQECPGVSYEINNTNPGGNDWSAYYQ